MRSYIVLCRRSRASVRVLFVHFGSSCVDLFAFHIHAHILLMSDAQERDVDAECFRTNGIISYMDINTHNDSYRHTHSCMLRRRGLVLPSGPASVSFYRSCVGCIVVLTIYEIFELVSELETIMTEELLNDHIIRGPRRCQLTR